MTPAGAGLTGLALAGWVVCFAVLARSATWLPFALVGAPLAVAAFRCQVLSLTLLRPSLGRVFAGVLGGVLMVALTHLAYALLAAMVPSVPSATRVLFMLLRVTGFSAAARTSLIIVIASCEEVLFRGPLLASAARGERRVAVQLTRRDSTRVFAFALGYALATVPLESALLTICAFICGSIWGFMGIAAGSLTVPILTHVIWDLGVLFVWPLSTR